jgi:hypothetical protein
MAPEAVQSVIERAKVDGFSPMIGLHGACSTGSTAAMALLLALIAGCATPPQSPEPVRQISLAEFTRERPEPASPAEPEAPADEPTPADGPLLGAGAEGVQRPELRPAAPDERETTEQALVRPLEPGDRVIVDSMVGQVNGRPIFADEFFEPIEDRLIAESRTSTAREFLRKAQEIIRLQLQSIVRNNLFLAEAESEIIKGEQQQMGLRSWLLEREQQRIATYRGSEEEARQELRERGTSLEEAMEEEKDVTLIMELFRQRISPRVIVSWRDVEREYQKEQWQERFNPPGKLTLARIRLSTQEDAELIDDVGRRLAAGEQFLEIAESLGQPGVWQTFEMSTDDLTDIAITNQLINERLAELDGEGDTTEPFQIGSSTWWLHVAEINRPERKSLYDPEVQRILTGYLREMRRIEEQDRFLRSLLDEAIYDELEQMEQRLLRIAMHRYAP